MSPRLARTALTLAVAAATSLAVSPVAAADKKRTHDGTFLRFDLGSAPVWVSSTGSASNGFAQEIPSSARGLFLPTSALAVGGTFESVGLVLAGRLGVSSAREPVFETLGRRFSIEEAYLTFIDLTALVDYYPRLDSGLHFGAGFGPAALGLSSGTLGAGFGFSATLEAGHAFFFANQWSLGAELRATLARTYGREGRDVATTLLSPGLFVTVTLH